MEDKKIKHFVFSRFFPAQGQEYLYNVLSTNFLKKQLPLVKNMFRSLENQTNKNFELVFLMNPKYFDNPKYEFVFTTLKESTTLPLTFIKTADIPKLLKEAYENYDFVIQSRMDFDDFLYKDGIADTQSKVDECENILIYGYCKGFLYVSEENDLIQKYSKGYSYAKGIMSHMFYPSRGIGHFSILQSIILKSSFASTLPFFHVYFSAHNVIKRKLKEFLEKNGVEFSEKMFQQNLTTNAFIYFRHEFAHFILDRNGARDTAIKDNGEVTADEITKKQLEEEFGFDYELKSIK